MATARTGLEGIIREWLDGQVNPRLDAINEALEAVKSGMSAPEGTIERLSEISTQLNEIKTKAIDAVKGEPEMNVRYFETMLDHAITCDDDGCKFREPIVKRMDKIISLKGVDDAEQRGNEKEDTGSDTSGNGDGDGDGDSNPEPEPEPEPQQSERRFFTP